MSADLWPLSRADEEPTPAGKLHWIGGGCAECDENAAASPIGYDDEWPNPGPPVHAHCDCEVEWVPDEDAEPSGGTDFPAAQDWQMDTEGNRADAFFSTAADEYMDGALSGESDLAQRIANDEMDSYETRALDYYQGDGFREINGGLRSGFEVYGEEFTEKASDTISDMDRLVKAQSFNEETVVFRGGRDSATMSFGDLKPGDRFTDRGYSSTTVFNKFAESWANKGGTVMQVAVPKGTNGLYLAGFGEGEVILARDTTFEVLQVADGVLKVRIVP